MSYEEEDTCMSYEEEDTCMSYEKALLSNRFPTAFQPTPTHPPTPLYDDEFLGTALINLAKVPESQFFSSVASGATQY
jgi:hypothetical protein